MSTAASAAAMSMATSAMLMANSNNTGNPVKVPPVAAGLLIGVLCLAWASLGVLLFRVFTNDASAFGFILCWFYILATAGFICLFMGI